MKKLSSEYGSIYSIELNSGKYEVLQFMTANAFKEDRRKALEKDMNGHIAKPIEVKKDENILFIILKNRIY